MLRKKKDQATADQEAASLASHLKALGFRTSEQYQAWCLNHGLSRRLIKDESLRRKEVAFARERDAIELLKTRRAKFDTSAGLLQVAREKRARSGHARVEPATLHSSKGSAKLTLLAHLLRCRVKFLDRSEAWPGLGNQPANRFDAAIELIVRRAGHWVRPVETWKPRSYNPLRQFQSLIRHLLAEYEDLPTFFDRVWFLGSGEEAQKQQRWYLQVASGINIRHCDTPIAMTKKMAHYFMQAPSDATVEQAIRWGQVHALAGDARLAKTLFATRLCEDFANEEFWSTVIAWLIANPMLDPAQVGPIIDYLNDQRFGANRWVDIGGHRELVGAPQPNLSMKGRSPETLLKQVETWHKALRATNRVQVAQWSTSGLSGFEFWEGPENSEKRKRWTIRELISSQALMVEGRQLQHCVSSYARSCAAGHCSIWTLELENRENLSKLVTLEVRNATRMIVQARGKANRVMTVQERAIVQRWASRVGLTLATYV